MPATTESPPADAALPMAPAFSTTAFSAPQEAPAKGDAPAEANSPKAKVASLDEASLGRLVPLLATHLGPVARVLVRRKAAESLDMEQLIRMLAQEIPAEGERLKFLMGARAVLAGPH